VHQHVAALPRSQGGLAIPVLQTELLALAAVTVAQWATQSSPAMLVIGDVLTTAERRPHQHFLQVTPARVQSRNSGRRLGVQLWLTGARICEEYGGHDQLPDKPLMVKALGWLASFHGAMDGIWLGRTMVMEVATLAGAITRRYIEAEARRHGVFCGEWVPYMTLTALRLITTDGSIVNPSTQYRALCGVGKLVKDVVHWTWTPGRNLRVTALTGHMTNAIRRQLRQLMTLLVLNYPQLIHPGSHTGSVRYNVLDPEHVPICRALDPGRRLYDPASDAPLEDLGTPIQTHGELTAAMQQQVGTTRIISVHPHPQLARMVCMWAGPRRWTATRQHFKRQLNLRRSERGITRRDQAHRKWKSHSTGAATGLEMLHWKKVRRVVGLTPWGEQLLLRVKHHALSVYNPIAAGLHCPHDECARAGSITLHHIFWTCPAAGSLRALLVKRWKTAGLRLEDYERAIFSLSLEGFPTAVMAATGSIIADCFDATIGPLGGFVESIITQCWTLDAAIYLHAVWRWRVSYFDDHNNTTREHHEAIFATRLRNVHEGIVDGHTSGPNHDVKRRVGRIICELLGRNWKGASEVRGMNGSATVLFYSGRVDKDTRCGYSGVMVAQVNRVTGRHRVLYCSGTLYDGGMTGVERPAQLGLLKGLRACRTYGWRQVHAVGDNPLITRQHSRRTPPRATALKPAYWTARRTADAVGVSSWMTHPRERNTTTQALARLVQDTHLGMEWNHTETRNVGENGRQCSRRRPQM